MDDYQVSGENLYRLLHHMDILDKFKIIKGNADSPPANPHFVGGMNARTTELIA